MQEIHDTAASINLDDDGGIDIDEFCVFMRPFLSIAHRAEFAVDRVTHSSGEITDESVMVSISSMGLRLRLDQSTNTSKATDPWAMG